MAKNEQSSLPASVMAQSAMLMYNVGTQQAPLTPSQRDYLVTLSEQLTTIANITKDLEGS